MEDTPITAQLFEQAQNLQNDARDIRDRLSNFYKSAAALKRLAVQVADQLNAVAEAK